MSEPVILCWSGGKDSAMVLYELQQAEDYEVVGLLTTVTSEYDRISMHGVRRTLLEQQAAALALPLQEVFISPRANNQEYDAQMGAAFDSCRRQGIRTVAFGDIFLEDLKEYRQRLLAEYDLQGLFPLWQRKTGELVETFLNLGFRAVITCIDLRQLDETYAGRELDRGFLQELPAGVDPCGENGEFHSFVFEGPIFQQPIPFTLGETVRRDSFLFRDLVSV